MAKSSTTTGSDALFLTDDLEGRLDEESLTGPVVKVIETGPIRSALEVLSDPPKFRPPPFFDSEFPDTEPEEVAPEPERLTALITFIANGECKAVEGTLQTFSFGKGWLCVLEGVDEDEAFAAAAHFGAHKTVLEVSVLVKGKEIQLTGELDFTISFGYGGVTFTVAADEGRYISV